MAQICVWPAPMVLQFVNFDEILQFPFLPKEPWQASLYLLFPPWLVSRAFIASASLEDLFGAGAKMSINIPLIIPEEDHIVWSLVIAGNLEQLRHLLSHDKNLVHIRNQWSWFTLGTNGVSL